MNGTYPIEVKPLAKYRIWLRYSNGVEGEVDLSDLAGRGVFQWWDEDDHFSRVRIGDHGEVIWGDHLDMCPDSLYLTLTGELPPGIQSTRGGNRNCS